MNSGDVVVEEDQEEEKMKTTMKCIKHFTPWKCQET